METSELENRAKALGISDPTEESYTLSRITVGIGKKRTDNIKLNVEKIGPREAGPQSRAPFRPQAEKHVSMAEGIHWSLARKAKAALLGTYEELPNKKFTNLTQVSDMGRKGPVFGCSS